MAFLTGNFLVFAVKLEAFIFIRVMLECNIFPFLLDGMTGVALLVFELSLMNVKVTVAAKRMSNRLDLFNYLFYLYAVCLDDGLFFRVAKLA